MPAAGPTLAQHHDEHDERALKEDPRLAPGQIAPVLEGLGDLHRPVTTSSERAQMFFDQGLRLTYGFNHQEALRAFKEAARLDPDCAMAYWGWALVLGPNLNLPMQPEVVEQAREAIDLALQKADKATPVERGLIQALSERYTDDPEADRAPLDAAYAGAMGALHEKHPDDADVATLYAASLMNLSPWNYWTKDGRPRPDTPTILSVLESVIARDPDHIGALHYYIHAVEPVDPHRGVAAADRLKGLTPGAGHLVHMPSHIYMQVGRYADSFEVNSLAARADEGYISQCRAQGIYPLGYYPHNLHFLTWAAMMQGRRAVALETARKVASKAAGNEQEDYWSLSQSFLSMPLTSMIRFGQWESVLREPEPPRRAIYLRAIRHYARGLAFLQGGRIDEARAELGALEEVAADPDGASLMIGASPATTLMNIAAESLSGEIAAKSGEYERAVRHLDRAVRLEDSLPYNEPPDWPIAARHTLGAILLEAGAPDEAEVVYWQDLERHEDNGFALFGLWKSLEAQGKEAEAADAKRRFEMVWADSDVKLASSRF